MLETLVRTALGFALFMMVFVATNGGVVAQNRSNIEIVPQLGHPGRGTITSATFSPDGRAVLSGGESSLKLWDAATGQLVRTFTDNSSNSPVYSAVFSPDGRSVLSAGTDKIIRLWDLATGRPIRTFEGHGDIVISVAFSPDGRNVLSGSQDKTVKLWDSNTGRLLRTFEGHTGSVVRVAFSPDGRTLFSGSQDKTTKLWGADTGRLIKTVEGHSVAALSPDGRNALSVDNKTLKLWQIATGDLLRMFEGHSLGVNSVAFSPDGHTAVSGGTDWEDLPISAPRRTVKLWDLASGKLLRTFADAVADKLARESWGAGRGIVPSVAVAPDGRSVLATFSTTLKLWDVATGQLRTIEGHGGVVNALAYFPDGRSILSGTYGRPLRLWDATSGRLVRSFDDRLNAVTSLTFSSDGLRVLVCFDATYGLWDVATGHLVRTFDEGATASALSPEGRTVLTASPAGMSGSNIRTLKLWDASTGGLLHTMEIPEQDGVAAVAFAPDGRSALTAGFAGALRHWDVTTGTLIRTFEGHSATVLSVAFSADGRSIISSSDRLSDSDNESKTLKLWDVASGRLLRNFEGHTGAVYSVAFSPDSRSVLSGGQDKILRLWDAATGRLLRSFEGHLTEINKVAFSVDGRNIISGASDGTIRFWSLEGGHEIVRLFDSPSEDWLTLTPTGFFDFSGDLDNFVHLVRDMEVMFIGQVHQSLFNPDLVREALAGDPGSEVAEASKVINLEKVLDSGPAPSVAITSPAQTSQSATDLLTVTARMEARGKGIGRIEWRVNGITAAVGAVPPVGGPVYTVSQQLALDPGDNTIEVVAYNASNLLASLPARATIKFTGAPDETKPKLYILAIGINAYIDEGWAPPGSHPLAFAPLGLAVKDAQAFAASMKKAAAGLYEDVRVTLALDQDATRDNLHKLVGEVAADIHPRDSFILFAAAHGDAENGRFYLIPQDYQSGPKGTLAQRAISQDDLQDWLANRIKARKAIILLDTCESGSLIAGYKTSRTDTPASEAAVGRLHEATGRPVLTAAAAGQQAGEGIIAGSREGHGYFTWAVLDALRYGDTNGNGLIELSELAAHVQSVVPKIAAGIKVRAAGSGPAGAKQAARFGSRGEDFVVARRLQ